jgi:hypothetical protein
MALSASRSRSGVDLLAIVHFSQQGRLMMSALDIDFLDPGFAGPLRQVFTQGP